MYCMKYHQEKYGHTTWHWMNVPESVLLNSGYIHDFNRLRLKRKEAYERDGVFYNPIQEYGLDGFAEEKCGEDRVIYHGIQAKLWNPKSILTATDLGTFFAAMLGRLRMKSSDSKGYIYHTCRLQADVRDDMLNTRGIIQQELLPFDESHAKSMTVLSTSELLPSISESAYTLRGYQEEAITMLGMGWSGVGLLNLPCGTGKTVIFSNHLREKKYKNVIIVSPLRVHAEQTLKRVKAFLPEYDQLLLDSDGSTDIDDLNEMMEKRSVISTTFKSFVQVIRQLFVESTESDSEVDSVESSYEPLIDLSDTLVIIDEAHNVASMSDEKQEMIKIIQSFPKTLLVTATPPSCMEEMIGCTTIYQYPFRCAIEEGHICDYQVYLPMITMDEASGESSVYIEKPIELSDLNGDMVQKSLYLLSGMLQTGSKRCIAYMSQKKECDLFMKVLMETNAKYHYLDLSVSSITKLTSGSKRKKIIEEFEKDDGRGEIKILCSIHILDEGVDIPACDSVFVGNVTESSNEIKMVQRICRANRLVESHPNKVANCFLWADDHQKIVGSLSLLKENDIEFHKKIKVMNANYEKSGDTEMIDLVGKHNASLTKFIRVKCMSLDEIWEMNRQRVFTFCDKYNGKRPSTKSKDASEKKNGQWLAKQILHIKSVEDKLYQKLAENDHVKKLMDETLKGRGKDLTYEESKHLCFAFFEANDGKRPSTRSKDESEKKSGTWLAKQILHINSVEDELYKDLAKNDHIKKLIDATLTGRAKGKGKREGKRLTYKESKSLCFAFCDTNNGKRPSPASEDESEKKNGRWLTVQISKIKSIDDELYKELAENHHVKKLIDETLEGRAKDRKSLCFSLCNANNGKRLSPKSKQECERKSGRWLRGQISKIKSVDDELYKNLSENDHVKKLIDETLKKRGIDKWKENKSLCFAFCNTNNGKRPSPSSKDEDEKKIGRWLTDQIVQIKSVNDELYKDLAENDHVKKLIDETLSKRIKK